MPTLRITAGTLRGRRVPIPRNDARPTSERARQAFFNILGDRVDGANFLDLFAGSGIFSFEAISRGAQSSTAVDISPKAAGTVRDLAREWNIPIQTMVGDALASIRKLPQGVAFDVVYADPPYDYPRYGTLIEAMDRELPLNQGATVAVEHRHGAALPLPATFERLVPWKNVSYGTVSIALFESP